MVQPNMLVPAIPDRVESRPSDTDRVTLFVKIRNESANTIIFGVSNVLNDEVPPRLGEFRSLIEVKLLA